MRLRAAGSAYYCTARAGSWITKPAFSGIMLRMASEVRTTPVNARRVGRVLLELIFPLYALASTPQRRQYWRNLPLRRSVKLFAAVFFVLSSAAFFADITSGGTLRFWSVIAFAAALGFLNVLVVIAEIRRPIFALAPLAVVPLIALLLANLPRQAPMSWSDATRHRVMVDAIGLFVGMMLGYRLFVRFSTTEGVEHVQLQTELALAHAIQCTLVPTVAYQSAGLQVYGRTVPSDAVGGDIVDLVAGDGFTLAYIADVSGHGISAGVLMGMLKTAIHHGVLLGQSLAQLLDGVNQVLPAVKEPAMYATLAAMRFTGRELEYTLAGHLPLLHFHSASREVTRYSMQQFPLGLFPDVSYASQRVQWAAGDLFALITDGLSETCDQQGEDFGLERLEQLLLDNSAKPLHEIFDIVLAAVQRYGKQADDRTLLLVRMLD